MHPVFLLGVFTFPVSITAKNGKWISGLVPERTRGRSADFFLVKAFHSKAEALQGFEYAKQRLLDIHGWQSLTGSFLSSSFELMSPQGRKRRSGTLAQEGDLIRLKLPGPNPFDWVTIEALTDSADMISLRVRPCTDPTGPKHRIAHHYKADATNTFSLRMAISEKGQWILEAHVNGRNEKPNGIRGFAAVLGPWLGLQGLQWNPLLRGLIAEE